MGPMIKTNILQYTNRYIEIVEAKIPVEELKVGL